MRHWSMTALVHRIGSVRHPESRDRSSFRAQAGGPANQGGRGRPHRAANHELHCSRPRINYEAIVDGLFATGPPAWPEHMRALKVRLLLTAGKAVSTLRAILKHETR